MAAEHGGSEHGSHVTRHLARLDKLDASRVEALLEKAGLRRQGSGIVTQAGGALEAADCARYLAAVQELLGETKYSFCRVNFALLGCSAVDPPGTG